jgi:type I restriction enzyme S subunit
MSKIEDLIRQFCPDGVEYVKLDEMGSFYSGLSGKSKEDFRDGNAKFITYVNIFNNPALKTDVEDKVKIADGEKQNTIQYGDLLFTGSSETPDECGMCSVLTHHSDENLYLNSFCFGFRFNDLSDKCPSFMKHLFRSTSIRKKICKTANGVTRYNISKKEFAKLEIPLPPLPVQEAIVNILDRFAVYAAELQARQQQYNYYRDTLLSFEGRDDVQWKKLGEVADLLSGFPFDSTQFTNAGVRLMRGVNIKRGQLCFNENDDRYWKSTTGLEKYIVDENDIVISMDGSLVGKSFGMVKKEHLPLLLVQRVARIRSSVFNINFIYHCINNWFPNYVDKKKTQGAIPHISMKDIANFPIPSPSLEEQGKIATILDRFDTLVNDLSQGLPAEIEARQQQYEYYRDRLLTFNRK